MRPGTTFYRAVFSGKFFGPCKPSLKGLMATVPMHANLQPSPEGAFKHLLYVLALGRLNCRETAEHD